MRKRELIEENAKLRNNIKILEEATQSICDNIHDIAIENRVMRIIDNYLECSDRTLMHHKMILNSRCVLRDIKSHYETQEEILRNQIKLLEAKLRQTEKTDKPNKPNKFTITLNNGNTILTESSKPSLYDDIKDGLLVCDDGTIVRVNNILSIVPVKKSKSDINEPPIICQPMNKTTFRFQYPECEFVQSQKEKGFKVFFPNGYILWATEKAVKNAEEVLGEFLHIISVKEGETNS